MLGPLGAFFKPKVERSTIFLCLRIARSVGPRPPAARVGTVAAGRYNLSMVPESIERLLVWLPNPLGDVVMATPALRALRRRYGDARITHVGRAVAKAVLSGSDLADDFVVDGGGMGLVRALRAGRYDLGVLFPNSFRTALLARLGGVGPLAGYARDGRGWLLKTKLAPARDAGGRWKPVPTIDYYRDLVAAVGASCESRTMELAVDPAGEEQARRLLARAGVAAGEPVVMLNPGAGFGPSKLWAPERFAAVADGLARSRGAQIVINAAPPEREVARRVAAAMTCPPRINLADEDNNLSLVKSLLRRSSLLITNDTGARHIAAAFGIGVVTIFGSTDPVWAQIDYERERLIRAEVPCSPCQKKTCPLPRGPEFHQCMTAITPETVLAAAEELLDAFPAPEGVSP